MEEDAEGVHLDEAKEGRSAGAAGDKGGGGAQAGPEDGEEREHLAAAREGLQEHKQQAEPAPDGFGEDAEEVGGLRDHGAASEVDVPAASVNGAIKPQFLRSANPRAEDARRKKRGGSGRNDRFGTSVAGGPPRSAVATVACSLRGGGGAVRASWGNWRCIWSRMFWEEAAKRRVKNRELTTNHRGTTAMARRIHLSRGEASDRVRFFSTVTSPKKTRW